MLKKSLTIVAVGAALAACNPGLPEATDEQLLMLFSEHETMGVAAIHRNAVECLEILSSDGGGLYVDLGPELRGQIMTNCRQALDKILKDADRNPVGFTMAHMEDPDLTERVTELREVQDARIDELREQQRAEKAEQQQLENEALDQKNREMLKQAKLDAAQYFERVRAFVEAAEPKCQELADLSLKRSRREVNFITYLNNKIYYECGTQDPKKISSKFGKILESAINKNNQVQEMAYSPEKRRRFHVPSTNYQYEYDRLAQKQAKIEELLSEVKSQIESNNS